MLVYCYSAAVKFSVVSCDCHAGRRSYSIHHVPKTNLMLLVVDAMCDCIDTTIDAEPIELSHILFPHNCIIYRDDNGSAGHGARVKWVSKSEWVTWVTDQYS